MSKMPSMSRRSTKHPKSDPRPRSRRSTPPHAPAAALAPLAAAPQAAASAAPNPPAADIVEVLTAVVGLILFALLAGLLVAVIRKRTLDANRSNDQTSLTLGGLRDLLKKGEITQQEFDAARNAVIAAHNPAATTKPPPDPDPPQPSTTKPNTPDTTTPDHPADDPPAESDQSSNNTP